MGDQQIQDQKWAEKKHELTRRTFFENYFRRLQAVPADRLFFYLHDEQSKAAIKIQSAWRGYKARKKFVSCKYNLIREKASITIQRAVRKWLQGKGHKYTTVEESLLEPIDDSTVERLQKEIDRWQERNSVKWCGEEDLEASHKEVQSKLAKFYLHASSYHSREKRTRALVAQAEAISTILENAPSLTDVDESDLSFYYCSSLPLATQARLRHKEEIRKMNAPWWKKLDISD